MVKGKVAYFVLGVVVVSALILRLVSFITSGGFLYKHETKSDVILEATTSVNVKDEQKFILEGETATTTVSATVVTEVSKDAVLIEPKINSVISSPLVVKGEAPGYWFFEASLPIKILDGQGNLIVSGPVSAESDPLTDNFVPFKGLLEFTTTATSGYIIINNDNPSGLIENELSVKIPVLFLNK
jgi:Immunoglobulin-like domain of bacterial spore germination